MHYCLKHNVDSSRDKGATGKQYNIRENKTYTQPIRLQITKTLEMPNDIYFEIDDILPRNTCFHSLYCPVYCNRLRTQEATDNNINPRSSAPTGRCLRG